MKSRTHQKILLAIIFIAFIACFSSLIIVTARCTESADVCLKEEWSKVYGGPYSDGVWSIGQARDGGYILAGYTAMLGQGGDLWLFKLDGTGNVIWQKVLVSSSGDGGWSLDEAGDGGYIVTGYTKSFGSGKKDLWLLKTDAAGKLQWEKTFGGREDDVGMSVVHTGDGGYVVAGRTASFGAGGDDIWLIKTDPQGNEEWNRTFGGKLDDAAFQIIETEGGLAAVGRTESGSRDQRIVLLKTDLFGRELWERIYPGSSGTSLQRTSDGGFIIAGRMDSEKTGRDALFIKTDSSGNEQWSLPLAAEGDGIGTFALESADGAYVFAGIGGPSRSESEDAWLRKYVTVQPEVNGANLGNEAMNETNLQISPQGLLPGSSEAGENAANPTSSRENLSKLEKIFKDKLQ